jgi:hypothetical protein
VSAEVFRFHKPLQCDEGSQALPDTRGLEAAAFK